MASERVSATDGNELYEIQIKPNKVDKVPSTSRAAQHQRAPPGVL